MHTQAFKVPVVLIIFNRPDTTEKVFEAIRDIRPEHLLVIADGHRPHKPGEADKCHLTRAIIDRVDWDCEVHTNYSDVNLGCMNRVVSGLNWVFEKFDEAIILEDDCLPHPSFFHYCEYLLEYYRSDTRVMHIAGTNLGVPAVNISQSYYFSRRTHIWGWATWRRAWQYYDPDIKLWPEIKDKNILSKLIKNPLEVKAKTLLFDSVYQKRINSWDYQWHLTCLLQGNYSVMPNTNLIENIGFSHPDATHTFSDSDFANLPVSEMRFPIHHPRFLIRDDEADNRYFMKRYLNGGKRKLQKATSFLANAWK
jgi:hypothetical protein